MKKILFSIFFLILFIGNIFSQEFSAELSLNYPVIRNLESWNSSIINQNSVFERLKYYERPGISAFLWCNTDIMFDFRLNTGLSIDWVNYRNEYESVDVYQNSNLNNIGNVLTKELNTSSFKMRNSLTYLSIPVDLEYPVIDKMLNVFGGVTFSFLLSGKQNISYMTNENNQLKYYEDTYYKGFSKMGFLFDLGVEYIFIPDISVTFHFQTALTPIYEKDYQIIKSSNLSFFTLGVKYQLPFKL